MMKNSARILFAAIFIATPLCCHALTVHGVPDDAITGSGRQAAEALYGTAIYRDVPADKYVWNWRDAVLMKAFVDIWRTDESRRKEVEGYVLAAMTRLAPKAHGRHPNGIASGVGLAFLKEAGISTPETDEALERVMRQYLSVPRSPNGACSHRPGKVELWDDTLYMLDIFLVQCWRSTGDGKYLGMLADEILSHAAYLTDPRTGLWYHGWAESGEAYEDSCCMKGWNTGVSHRNDEFWGRGNGWVAMALADLLEVLPAGDPRYPRLKSMFLKMAKTLLRHQDRHTGLWYQLPAHPRDKKNFLESSGTAMFACAFAKAAASGILDRKYMSSAKKAYEGLVRHCIGYDDKGYPVLGRICEGTCIGDRGYYYSRRIISGETYATGAFLMLQNNINNQ